MGCYAVPLIAGIIHYGLRKAKPSWNNQYHQWLSLLFAGGTVFGIVDHAWHGELFLISDKILLDLLLGVIITLVILGVWAGMVIIDQYKTLQEARH